MAKSVLDIVIKTTKEGHGDKQVTAALTALKTGLGAAATAFAVVTGAAYAVDKALDATVGKYVTYGQNVRDAKIALGLSADETLP
jgi:hypothetical protein